MGMNHIMVDLETLGTKPTSVFLSLAAIQFDIDTGQTGKLFDEHIELETALRYGLTMNASTIEWWMKQDADTRRQMFNNKLPLSTVLIKFSNFIHEMSVDLNVPEPLLFWGNSASFDLGILGNAFDVVDIERPWKYSDERCYRTVTKLFPDVGKDIENKHNHVPLADCFYQIARLHKVWTHWSSASKKLDEAYRMLNFISEDHSDAIAKPKELAKQFLHGDRPYQWEMEKKDIADKRQMSDFEKAIRDSVEKGAGDDYPVIK